MASISLRYACDTPGSASAKLECRLSIDPPLRFRTNYPTRPQDLSDVWLNGKSFLGGDDICIADLSVCCELQMLELMDGSLQVQPG